jgi:hypothetical protein
MTFTHKLRALVAGMRYAAEQNEEYARQAISSETRAGLEGRAAGMRGDANALEALLNEHDRDEATRAAR